MKPRRIAGCSAGTVRQIRFSSILQVHRIDAGQEGSSAKGIPEEMRMAGENIGTGCIVVLVTASGAEEADKIADALVGGKLAACVNVLPGVKSIYNWKGKRCRDEEVLLLIKSTSTLFPRIRDTVQALHSYEIPEMIALPVRHGSKEYIHWLRESVI